MGLKELTTCRDKSRGGEVKNKIAQERALTIETILYHL